MGKDFRRSGPLSYETLILRAQKDQAGRSLPKTNNRDWQSLNSLLSDILSWSSYVAYPLPLFFLLGVVGVHRHTLCCILKNAAKGIEPSKDAGVRKDICSKLI